MNFIVRMKIVCVYTNKTFLRKNVLGDSNCTFQTFGYCYGLVKGNVFNPLKAKEREEKVGGSVRHHI
jgi:hypothetical protein